MNPPASADPAAPSQVERVLVTDPLHADGLAALRDAEGVELIDASDRGEDGWRDRLSTATAWIVRSGTKVRAEHLAAAPALRVVGRAGVGVDNVDVAAATARGVLVMNAPDANSVTTAELAIAHLLAMARNLVRGDGMVRAGEWRRKELVGNEVEGKTLGVIGLGRIGRKVAEKGAALGMRVLAHDPYVSPGAVEDQDIELRSLEDLIPDVDFLSLHLPLTEATRGILDRERMASMKPGVRLINCARGGLIDEEALVEALKSGQVAGAALDVFTTEPPPVEHPLLNLPGVTTTPHLGASTTEASRKVSVAIAEQVLDYLAGRRIRHAVNLPPMDRAVMSQVQPWADLAERCGRMISQLVDWPIEAVQAEYRGEVSTIGTRFLTQSFLAGLLTPVLDRPVNLVNAAALAEERGLRIEEVRSSQPRDFQSLVVFRLDGPNGSREIGGTLFGTRMPRVVLLDGARLEVVPEGHLLVLRNEDQPGVIGHIGTLLGEAGLNIAAMSVSPPARDGLCRALLHVEEKIGDELAARVAEVPGVMEVKRANLS